MTDKYKELREALESGPTPVPWQIHYEEYFGYDCMTAGVYVGPALLDGAKYGQDLCEPIKDQQKEKMISDAHLIAAAPDLLEALGEMLQIYGDRIDSECRRKDAHELECIDNARAAIAKALGESK